jgi:hypothetical protein
LRTRWFPSWHSSSSSSYKESSSKTRYSCSQRPETCLCSGLVPFPVGALQWLLCWCGTAMQERSLTGALAVRLACNLLDSGKGEDGCGAWIYLRMASNFFMYPATLISTLHTVSWHNPNFGLATPLRGECCRD